MATTRIPLLLERVQQVYSEQLTSITQRTPKQKQNKRIKSLQNLRRPSQKLPIALLSVIQQYLLLIILQSTTSSLKQTMIQSSCLVLQARKINFQTIFHRKTLIIIFSEKSFFLNYFEITQRNGFRCKRFNQWTWVVPNSREHTLPAWWNPVLSNITVNKTQRTQILISPRQNNHLNWITQWQILITSQKNSAKPQTIIKPLTYLLYHCLMDKNSKIQRIKLCLEALLNTNHSHKSKPLALSRPTH